MAQPTTTWTAHEVQSPELVTMYDTTVTRQPDPELPTKTAKTMVVLSQPFSDQSFTRWGLEIERAPFLFQCGLFTEDAESFWPTDQKSSPTRKDSISFSCDNVFRSGSSLHCRHPVVSRFRANDTIFFSYDPDSGLLGTQRRGEQGCSMQLSKNAAYTFFVKFWKPNTIRVRF